MRRRARPAPPRADGGRQRPSRLLRALPNRAAAPGAACPAMELWQVPLSFSRLRMFPFFDLAHYVASILALKEQRGERGEAGRGGHPTPPMRIPVFPPCVPGGAQPRQGEDGAPRGAAVPVTPWPCKWDCLPPALARLSISVVSLPAKDTQPKLFSLSRS